MFVDGGQKKTLTSSCIGPCQSHSSIVLLLLLLLLNLITISGKMPHTHFELMNRCLHVTNPENVETNRENQCMRKLGKSNG